MDRKQNKALVPTAKVLRRKMTDEERHLWYDFLRDYPVKFRRQKILGRYIADFYCASAGLVIELDGSGHYEEKGIEHDTQRDRYLEQYKLRVIRIPNTDVNRNFQGVCEYIDSEVRKALQNELQE